MINNLFNMRNRWALVTGASGNLGTVISSTLASLGANLILVDQSKTGLINLKKKLSKYKIRKIDIFCNLENEESRIELYKKIKDKKIKINCLVNNASMTGSSDGNGWNSEFQKQTLEMWRKGIEVNLTAVFHLTQLFMNDLKKSKGANIINIASIYGELGPDWSLYKGTNMNNPAAYSVSKGGLIQFTRWASTTMSPKVRVNAISPGGIKRNQPKSFIKKYISRTPLKRMATESDIIGAITFLATDMSAYVTGQIIKVDGGWSEW